MDPTPLAEAGAVTAIVTSEVGKKLLLPFAEQVGLAFGDLGKYVRDNLDNLWSRHWGPLRNGKTLSSEELQKALPLLQLAGMQSDEELQGRWAALLESTATDALRILPSFGRTLSELTSEEAKFLDRILAFAQLPSTELPMYRPGRQPISRSRLVELYDPKLNPGMNPAEWAFFEKKWSPGQLENYEKLGHFELLIQDLERLGLLSHEAAPDDSDFPSSHLHVSSQMILKTSYALTQYGVSFIRAVTQKQAG